MDFPDNCPCNGGNLDRFLQPIILSIVTKQPGNGYSIAKSIAAYSTFEGRGPDLAGVYRYLKIMAAKGLLEKQPDESGEKELYSITLRGRQCLNQWLVTLHEYTIQINRLMAELKEP